MEVVREESKEEVDSGSCGGGGGGGGKKKMVRVLVVDDSAVDRKVVEMLLKRSGERVEVVTADTAKKAMEILGLNEAIGEPSSFNDNKIDIILTDYCMPEMSGYDLLKAVKEHSSLRSMPVFIMSSENSPQRISRCRAIGAVDFILKPLKKKDVERLMSYSEPLVQLPKAGTKRKVPVDLIAEKGSSETRQRLTKVAVA